MTDHAARRNAGIDKTLAAIDAVTGCMTCGGVLDADGPSDLYCGPVCQNASLRHQSDGTRWSDIGEDRSGIETPMRWRPDRSVSTTDHPVPGSTSQEVLRVEVRDGINGPVVASPSFPAQSGDSDSAPEADRIVFGDGTRDLRYRGVYLNRATPARHIMFDGGTRLAGLAVDEITAPQIDFDAFREAFRAATDGLVRFFDQFADTIREAAPLIEALTDNSDQFNQHLRLPADDPRRAILHYAQNRGTGPASTPFAKRGRR